MTATTTLGIPYPEQLIDPPNGAQQIQDAATVINSLVAAITVVGLPAGATVSLGGSTWTDLCTVTFTLAYAQPVEIVGWARFQSTGAGRPMVALQVLDGATHLFGIGQKHIGGTSDTLGEEDTLSTPRRRVALTAGSHTLKLQAYRDTNGVVDVKKTQTLAGQAIDTTGIEATYLA